MSNDPAAAADPALEPGDFAEAAEPFALFDTWLADATRHEPNDPNAMALATVDAAGHPNVRMVLLKAVDPGGPSRARLRLLHQLRERQGPRARRHSACRARLPLEEPASAGARARAGDADDAPPRPTPTSRRARARRRSAPGRRSSRVRWKAALRWKRPLPSRRPNTSIGTVPRPPLLVGLPRHAARDRVLAQPLVATARAHRLQAARRPAATGSKRAFTPRTLSVSRACLDRAAAVRANRARAPGRWTPCRRAANRSARPWC